MKQVFNYVGNWTFPKKVSIKEIETVASQLKKEPGYKTIYISHVSASQYGLYLEYKNANGHDKDTFEKYLLHTKKYIESKVGGKLTNWSMANMYYKIK